MTAPGPGSAASPPTGPLEPPPPPAPPSGAPRLPFDGSFVGPLVPPPAPPTGALGGARAPVTEAVRAIPLGSRRLVGHALDLLTQPDAGLRAASFYIGFIVLLTAGPVVMLGALAVTLEARLFEPGADSPLNLPIAVASLLAIAGYLVAGVESRALATAVIGARAEARPLRLRESIAIARRRFWMVFGGNVVVGLTAGLLTVAIQVPLGLALGNVEAINYGLSLVVGTVVAAPFAYVPAGIVLGGVGVFEAIGRSFRLARTRVRLALVVALFSILSQFIVLFGISIGGDVVLRVVDGTGIGESFPAALAIPVAAALTFAFGTLLFLVEAIVAAPAVYAFIALTHYTHGLQDGRDAPAGGTRLWDPWLTKGLAVGAWIGVLALFAAIAGLPG